MAIIKIQKRECFTVIPNQLLQDKRISFRAKGLLCYLLHLPKDWEVSVQHLAHMGPDGRDAVYSIIKELIANGYVTRERTRDSAGKCTGMDYTVYDVPHLEGREESLLHPDMTEVADADQAGHSQALFRACPLTDFPEMAKPDVLIKTIVNKNEEDKELREEKAAAIGLSQKDVLSADSSHAAAASFTPLDAENAKMGEVLTETQQKILFSQAKILSHKTGLSLDETYVRLKNIMLSKTSFTGAKNDFMKKLNTVIKALKEGTLHLKQETPEIRKSPALMTLEDEYRKVSAEIASNKAGLRSPIGSDPRMKKSFEEKIAMLFEKHEMLHKQILQGV